MWAPSFVGVLCNGSISDFDSESVGSIPTTPAMFLLGYSLGWSKAAVFEIVITGSNPVTSAKCYVDALNG